MKFKSKHFKISEPYPKIFLFHFKKQYQMCMHFVRFQEYYESPNSNFRGKYFELHDFMEWYAETYGDGVFTYTEDWGGFNVPGETIEKFADITHVNHFNEYEDNMLDAHEHCFREVSKEKDIYADDYVYPKFYIIGAYGEGGAINHEIAHGLLYLNEDYKKEMEALVKTIDPNFRKRMEEQLIKAGYTKKVFVDEIQAYLATGSMIKHAKYEKQFQKVFQKYYKKA